MEINFNNVPRQHTLYTNCCRQLARAAECKRDSNTPKLAQNMYTVLLHQPTKPPKHINIADGFLSHSLACGDASASGDTKESSK